METQIGLNQMNYENNTIFYEELVKDLTIRAITLFWYWNYYLYI